jgi:dolichol-phosphate mannosyltransferase
LEDKTPVVYSVIIPVFNEEGSLPVLMDQLLNVMPQLNDHYEILFVNDGSTDTSPQILDKMQNQYSFVRVITMEKRSGQTKGIKAGIDNAKGEFLITLDADLQNDPADIPVLLTELKRGYDCVCGWRRSRKDTFLKAVLSKTGNVLQRMFTGLHAHDISCTLRAYRREWALRIPLNWEGQHRFIPLCLALQGAKVGEVVSNHRPRSFGSSKYGHKRIFRVIADFFRILSSGGKK